MVQWTTDYVLEQKKLKTDYDNNLFDAFLCAGRYALLMITNIYWMLSKCQTLCFLLLSHSISSGIFIRKALYHPCFMRVDIEASGLRISAQWHTPSGWDVNFILLQKFILRHPYWLSTMFNGTRKGKPGNKEQGEATSLLPWHLKSDRKQNIENVHTMQCRTESRSKGDVLEEL